MVSRTPFNNRMHQDSLSLTGSCGHVRVKPQHRVGGVPQSLEMLHLVSFAPAWQRDAGLLALQVSTLRT